MKQGGNHYLVQLEHAPVPAAWPNCVRDLSISAASILVTHYFEPQLS